MVLLFNLLYDFGQNINLIMYFKKKETKEKIWPDNVKQYFQAHNSIHWNMNKLVPNFIKKKRKERKKQLFLRPYPCSSEHFYYQDLVLMSSSPGCGKTWWYLSFHLMTSLCSFSSWLDEYLHWCFVCPDWRCILSRVFFAKEKPSFVLFCFVLFCFLLIV